MKTARPLDRFPLVRVHDVEGAREAFAQVYSNTMTLQPLGPCGAFDVAINNYQLSQIGLNYTGYGADVRVHFSGSKFVTLSFPLAGGGEIAVNGSERGLNAHCGLVTSAGTPFWVNLVNKYEHVVLRIAPEALQAKLEALVGMPIDGPLKFDPLLDFSDTGAKLLRDQFFFLINVLGNAAAPLPKLAQAEFEQALIVMFLHATRHGYSRLLKAEGPEAALADVHRAEDYIAANWQHPITLEDLAAVTGVSAHSLLRSFKQYRGYTPTQFAERLRDNKRGTH